MLVCIRIYLSRHLFFLLGLQSNSSSSSYLGKAPLGISLSLYQRSLNYRLYIKSGCETRQKWKIPYARSSRTLYPRSFSSFLFSFYLECYSATILLLSNNFLSPLSWFFPSDYVERRKTRTRGKSRMPQSRNSMGSSVILNSPNGWPSNPRASVSLELLG